MRSKRAKARADRRSEMKNDDDADGDDEDIDDETQGNVFLTCHDKENNPEQMENEYINTGTKPDWQENFKNMEEDMEFNRENCIKPNPLDFGNRDAFRGAST